MMALMTAWSFASPLMSVPDEPAHAIRAAAVVRGEILSRADPDVESGPGGIRVPAYIDFTQRMGCFAFDAAKSAACQTDYPGDDADRLVPSGSSAQSNSPVYYAIVGLPTLAMSGDAALYAMRLVSALLSSVVLAFTFTMLWMRRRHLWSLVGFVVAVTPMVLFLGGGINPNAIEAASAASLFVSLVSIIRDRPHGGRLYLYGTIAVASVILVTSGRSIGLLWLLLVAAGAFIFVPGSAPGLFKRASTWIIIGLCAAFSVAALGWFLIPQPAFDTPLNSDASLLAVLQQAFERGLDYWSGMIGYFGWLDAASPTITYFIWNGLIIALVVGAVLLGTGTARWAGLGFGVALIVVPVLIQASLYRQFGLVWQGRYVLALLFLALIASGMALDAAARAITPPIVRVLRAVVVGMAIGHLLGFVWALRRYVVAKDSWIAMIQAPQWQPPLSWLFWSLFYAVVLAIATVALWVRLGRAGSDDPTSAGALDASNDPGDVNDQSHQRSDGERDDALRGGVER